MASSGACGAIIKQEAESDNLFPPKDKRARKLWHDLQAFKKLVLNGRKQTSLMLPPEGGYLRACAHTYAARLGMTTETQSVGAQKAVKVMFTVEAADAAVDAVGVSACASSSSSASLKRKSPHDADAAAVGAASSVAGKASSPPSKKLQPEQSLKKRFIARFGMCAKAGDAAGAAAAFRELLAADIPCTAEMCATLLHTYCAASTPMLEEAAAVFGAVTSTGSVPDEPAWSGYVKLRCVWGDMREVSATRTRVASLGRFARSLSLLHTRC